MQRSFRKAFALAAVFVLMLALTTQTFAYNFDGTQSSWAASDLDAAYDLGLTYPDIMGQFRNDITREEFCTIVVRLYEKYTGV